MQLKKETNNENYTDFSSLNSLSKQKKLELINEFLLFLKQKTQSPGIPVSIFNKKLSSLESLVKYLREEKELNYKKIAKILKKHEGPVGVTYRKAKTKLPEKLAIESNIKIPFNIFSKKLTTFESLILHLKKQFSFKKISQILHRNYRTIWSTHQRAKKKSREVKNANKMS